jgi:hypothetical protein
MDQDAREHRVFDDIGEIAGVECVSIVHDLSWHDRPRAPSCSRKQNGRAKARPSHLFAFG